MSELQNARQMLDEAERAARAGDFTSADERLRNIARIQETELGALHPELANTLNNLAIVAERRGRPGDAEAFYSRSAMIASATLPPEHPMVVTSQQNLEAFRRARAASASAPATKVAAKDPDLDLKPAAPEPAARPAKPPSDPRPAAKTNPRAAVPPPSEGRRPVPPAPQPPPTPRPPAPSLATSARSWVLIGVLALLTAGLLANQEYRNWLLHEAEGLMRQQSAVTPAPTSTSTPKPPVSEPEAPPSEAPTAAVADAAPSASSPTERTSPTAPATLGGDRGAASVSTSEITVPAVQLCRSLSTGSWRCDPAGNPVAEGPLVLYTRVRSPRGGSVVHQWYHGDTLRKSVPLKVRANATEGFRTYSRLTVDEPGDWRVEVNTADGERLHEERFSVR